MTWVASPGSGSAAFLPESLPLQVAREAAAAGQWSQVLAGLAELDAGTALRVDDLELLGRAAFMCGDPELCREAWLRAYQAHLGRGDRCRAARVAVQIGLGQVDTGEVVQASGCLPATVSGCAAWAAQAAQLLAGEPESAESGYVRIPEAFGLLVAGQIGDAERAAGNAPDVGRRFGDPDVVSLAGLLRGRALVRLHRHVEGIALVDEAVDLAVSGGVSAPHAGLVLASAAQIATGRLDLGRLDRYTADFGRWCDAQPGMVRFTPYLRGQQAALARAHGEWDQALALADDVVSAEVSDAAAAAAACYEAGDIHRLRGDFAAAQEDFTSAAAHGRDPQPGLALLRHALGDTERAVASLDRALVEASDDSTRVALLSARVAVSTTADDLGAADAAAASLAGLAADVDSPVVDGHALVARSRTALARGDGAQALPWLRAACRIWGSLRMPFEEGQARVLLSAGCRMLGDDDGARMEREAATGLFARLGVPTGGQHVRLAVSERAGGPQGLTEREMDVLGMLATGSSNKQIAAELVLSVRTVETHVSNLLSKMGVPNRASAVAHARRRRML